MKSVKNIIWLKKQSELESTKQTHDENYACYHIK